MDRELPGRYGMERGWHGHGVQAALCLEPTDGDTWVWFILWYPLLVKMLILPEKKYFLEKKYFQGEYPFDTTGS